MAAPDGSESPGLAQLNAWPRAAAEQALLACCASTRWAAQVAAGRPYASQGELFAAADQALKDLSESDVDEALAGHPRIGERAARGGDWSRREQAGVDSASAATLAALAEGNREYEERFGHVYLVCAEGRSADELLAILHRRLDNDPRDERSVLRTELGKINRIRLRRLIEPRPDRYASQE